MTYADALFIRTSVHVSWADRLRILIHGRMVVETETQTENEVGSHHTTSNAYAPAVFPQRPRGTGQVMAQ
jgi:hypothetical protein